MTIIYGKFSVISCLPTSFGYVAFESKMITRFGAFTRKLCYLDYLSCDNFENLSECWKFKWIYTNGNGLKLWKLNNL